MLPRAACCRRNPPRTLRRWSVVKLNGRRRNDSRKVKMISSSDSPRMALSIRTRRVALTRRDLRRRKIRRKARPHLHRTLHYSSSDLVWHLTPPRPLVRIPRATPTVPQATVRRRNPRRRRRRSLPLTISLLPQPRSNRENTEKCICPARPHSSREGAGPHGHDPWAGAAQA